MVFKSFKVSIYAPGLDASFVDDAIDGLRLCWPVLREMMTFHLGKVSSCLYLNALTTLPSVEAYLEHVTYSTVQFILQMYQQICLQQDHLLISLAKMSRGN